MKKPNKNIYWIDLFCGAGGTSTGIHLTSKNTKVLACVNHDEKAIKSHELNHPESVHFIEDVRNFEVVVKLKKIVEELRKKEPLSIVNIWASLECTNFSKAKGGQPKNADSRSLADHMFMYIENIKPDYFFVENVKEFMSWGPLCDKGKPISKHNGKDYLKWIDNIKLYGYKYDYKILNAADYGAYQTRERLFIQFSKPELLIKWPEQTHAKKEPENSLFPIKKWNQVKDILDLEDQGKSIFDRKIPLVDKTINVIIKGIEKALKEQEEVFMFKYYGNGDNYNSINTPSGTVTTKDRFAKVQLIFNQYKNGSITKLDVPIGSITTTPKCNILTFIMNPSHGGHTTLINRPSPTVIARQDKAPLYILQTIMKDNNIVDVKMRMANISELLQMQGFPKDYKLFGTKTDQKKFIGNAVEVNQAKALISANLKAVIEYERKTSSDTRRNL